MEKVKQLVPKAAVLLAAIVFGFIVQQSCFQDATVGSKFNDSDFVENLSNYE